MKKETQLRRIGVVRTAPGADPVIQARYAPTTRGVVELDDALTPALDGLERFDWAWLVTLLDRAVDPRDSDAPTADALRPVPFLLTDQGTRVGIFASRYPARPNRLGLSLVRIERVEGTSIHFSGVDVFDGTPVLDVKPWISDFDLPSGARAPAGVRCGWFDTLPERPLTFDDPGALVLVARDVAGRAALVARTVSLDGLGSASSGEVALIDRNGIRAGRILEGAVDDALGAVAAEMLADPRSSARARLVGLDVDGTAAARAGLTCGGIAIVVLQPADQVPVRWWEALAQRRPVALITGLDTTGQGSVVVEPGRLDAPAPAALVERAFALLAAGRSGAAVESSDDGQVLVEATVPGTRLVVVGSAALAGDLVHLAGTLGWTGELVDDVDLASAVLGELGPQDAIIVLDHGLTRTGPLLARALAGPVGYVGALGSRRTQHKRTEHLRTLGVTEDALDRLHGPAGLDLGPTNRAEIALSICAEILAIRSGRSALPLRDSEGFIMG